MGAGLPSSSHFPSNSRYAFKPLMGLPSPSRQRLAGPAFQRPYPYLQAHRLCGCSPMGVICKFATTIKVFCFSLQVSILHIVHFAGLGLDKPRYPAHFHAHILTQAAILLRYAAPILGWTGLYPLQGILPKWPLAQYNLPVHPFPVKQIPQYNISTVPCHYRC